MSSVWVLCLIVYLFTLCLLLQYLGISDKTQGKDVNHPYDRIHILASLWALVRK